MAAYKSAIHKFYVHYHAISYLKERDAKNFPFYTYAKNKSKEYANTSTLNSKLSTAQKEEYLRAVNALMGRTRIDSHFDPKLVEYEKKRIEEIMSNKLKNKLQLDYISGKVSKIIDTGSLDAESTDQLTNNKQKEAVSDTRLTTLLRQIIAIRTDVEQIVKSNTVNIDKLPTLTRLYEIENTLNHMIAQAEDLAKRDAEGHIIGYQRDFAALHPDKKWYSINESEAGELRKIDALIKRYYATSQAATKAQGDYFEEVLASAARVCAGSTDEWIGQAVGSLKEQMQFRLDGIHLASYTRVFRKPMSQQKIITDKQGNRYVIMENYSQGKVDVKAYFPIKDQIDNTKWQPVTISAKSYSSLSQLGSVHGVSLWTFLQNENKYFIKAYLNTIAKHEAIRENHLFADKYYEQNAIATIQKQKYSAIQAMKVLAAYRALTGDTMGRQKAQLFVVNDVQHQKIHLLEMADIFRYISTQILTDKDAIDRYFNFHETLGLGDAYSNSWHPSGEDARIGELLHEVHQQKLEIIFKPHEIINTPEIVMIR